MTPNEPGRRRYPSGPKSQITEQWKQSVQDWIRDNRKNNQWLAQQIGKSAATISRILAPGSGTSSYVDAICRVTGLPPPMASIESGDQLEIVAIWAQLDDRRRAALIEAARLLLPVSG